MPMSQPRRSPGGGRAVLITGCSSGIGRALARGLAARGYRVFATARREADVAALAAEGFESHRLDLAEPDSIRTAVAAVLSAAGGRLHGLVNNGAYGQPGAVEDLSRAALRAQFETNVFGAQELTNCLLPAMRAAGAGRIVQISSLLGFVCLPFRGAYNASKYALEALSDTLRLELAGSGIHVALIEPGPIRSRFRANAYRALQAHVDIRRSPHRALYEAVMERLRAEADVPFTLPPEALLAPVCHALEHRRPRTRYRVTVPARLLWPLKRLLPDRWLDALVLRLGGEGRR